MIIKLNKVVLEGIDDNGEITADAEEAVNDELKAHFRPEFLNRLDEVIMFKPLTKDNISGIIVLLLKELNDRLADRELEIVLTDAAMNYIVENGYDPVYGARPLKRYLQKYVETAAARIILEGEVPSPLDPPKGCPFADRCNRCMEICRQEKPVLKPEGEEGHSVACHLY